MFLFPRTVDYFYTVFVFKIILPMAARLGQFEKFGVNTNSTIIQHNIKVYSIAGKGDL